VNGRKTPLLCPPLDPSIEKGKKKKGRKDLVCPSGFYVPQHARGRKKKKGKGGEEGAEPLSAANVPRGLVLFQPREEEGERGREGGRVCG